MIEKHLLTPLPCRMHDGRNENDLGVKYWLPCACPHGKVGVVVTGAIRSRDWIYFSADPARSFAFVVADEDGRGRYIGTETYGRKGAASCVQPENELWYANEEDEAAAFAKIGAYVLRLFCVDPENKDSCTSSLVEVESSVALTFIYDAGYSGEDAIRGWWNMSESYRYTPIVLDSLR